MALVGVDFTGQRDVTVKAEVGYRDDMSVLAFRVADIQPAKNASLVAGIGDFCHVALGRN
jgi:hypothetical protein